MSIRTLATAWAFVALAAAARLAAGTPAAQDLYLEPEARARILVTPIAEHWSGEGFMPVRVRIENDADRPREWALSFFAVRGYSGHEVRNDSVVQAPAGGVAETVCFVAGGVGEARIGTSVRVEAEGPGTNLGRGRASFVRTSSDPVIVTATTPALESALFAATNGAPGSKSVISAVDVALWPADWRTWSPFQRVVLTDADYAALDGARRAALRDWVALGGTLDLYPARGRGEPGEEHLGHGAIRRQASALADEAVSRPLVTLHLSTHMGLQNARLVEVSVERRKELMPGTGALGLSFFLLGFGVLVGPINLFVFAPAQRRQRLFLTVPLISLAASLLMVGYIVVKDGFGGEGSQRGLVLLLPESNQAVVTQQQVARTGVLLGGSFTLPGDVMMAQISQDSNVRGTGNTSFQRHGDEAGGDWFTSRRVQEHALRRLAPTRARVELVAGGQGESAPVVQSSVGVILRDFVYLDAQGYGWSAPEVAPGVRVTLRTAPGQPTTGMLRGTFAAVGGAAEGLTPIPTLESIRWDEPEFLYTGPLVGGRTP